MILVYNIQIPLEIGATSFVQFYIYVLYSIQITRYTIICPVLSGHVYRWASGNREVQKSNYFQIIAN